MTKKLIIILGGCCLLLILISVTSYYYFIRLPLPLTDGELRVEGLKAPVRVLRDEWGVPHIYAANQHDLFFAQGFVQAQDRLWQMETNRRVGAGRLSEVIGPEALETDKLLRTLGLMRAARSEVASYDDSSLRILQAYSEGVNAFIESRRDRLPIEFRLAGVSPEPWRPEDSIAWAKVMALLGGKNWQEEIIRAMLIRKLGSEKAKALLGLNKQGTPTIIPDGMDLAALWPLIDNSRSSLLPALGGASNNWSVHGSHTTTGSPILANDMHLVVMIPSVWYEIHLVGGGFDVTGLSLPGIPLVIAGHNKDLAWGITFAYIDDQDIYLERMNTNRPGRYLYKGEWLKAERIAEPIRVKGQDKPVVHEVLQTRHGPIISPQVPATRVFGYALALKWSAHDPGCMLSCLVRMNLARNWEEFKTAAQDWSGPAINLGYADREGKIGYILAGRIPVRSQGHGQGPFEGWTSKNEWLEYLSPHKKPFLLDPPKGFLLTANNRVAGPDYPHYISVDYSPGFRAARINEVLLEKKKVSKADCGALQGDLKSLSAGKFIEALNGIKIKSTEARDLMNRLYAWDCVLAPGSVGGAIYSVLFYRLMENTFRDELGPLADRFFGVGLTPVEPLNRFVEHSRIILLGLMNERESSWFDNIDTQQKETLPDILEKSLNETAVFLKQNLGPDPSTWRWGRLHKVAINHPFGRIKPLDRLFNLGPYEGGGHFSTVWQSAVSPGMDFNLNGWTASNRHIYDLNDWDQSLGAIVPGQSGMVGSPHYDDQVPLWLKVDHHPLYYSRSKVESKAVGILVLRP
jgi:penicillin amidase